MTAKRFKLHPESNQWIWDTEAKTKKHRVYSSIDAKELIDLLNELHEENDVLKQELKTKVVVNKQYEELQKFKQENEQLKESVYSWSKSYNRVYEENEQLKRTIETQNMSILRLQEKITDCTRILSDD